MRELTMDEMATVAAAGKTVIRIRRDDGSVIIFSAEGDLEDAAIKSLIGLLAGAAMLSPAAAFLGGLTGFLCSFKYTYSYCP